MAWQRPATDRREHRRAMAGHPLPSAGRVDASESMMGRLEGMTGPAGDASGESKPDTWLRRAGLFPEVVGYVDAVSLLSDPRMHAQSLEILLSPDAASRPARELIAASLLSMNGEEHRRLRSLVAAPFTPRAVNAVRPVAREAAHDLIRAVEPTGRWEFITEFAVPYVQRTTSHHIGFPKEDVGAYWTAVELIAAARSMDDFVRGVTTLVEYAKPILRERSRHPRDDVLTLVAQQVARGSLPETVGLVFVTTLLSAGHEPTIKQLGIMVSELSRRPAIWNAVATERLAPPRVVEAVLRFRSTNRGMLRRVAEPFEHRGVKFREGELIVVNTHAANHDACRFAEPDQLDLDADASSHLAFGFGPHFCLGAALARVQLQEALRVLTRRLHCAEVVDVAEIEGEGLAGPSSLVLSVSSRTGGERRKAH
jgi:cytochrome P450